MQKDFSFLKILKNAKIFSFTSLIFEKPKGFYFILFEGIDSEHMLFMYETKELMGNLCFTMA